MNSLKELQVPSPFSNSIFATRGRTVSRMLKVAVLQIMNFYENVFKSNKPGEKKDFLVQIPYFPGLMMSMLMTIFSNSSFGHKNVACSSILKYAFLYEHRGQATNEYNHYSYHQSKRPLNSLRMTSKAQIDLRIRIYSHDHPCFHAIYIQISHNLSL